MLAIRGYGSSLAQHFLQFMPAWERAVPVERGANNVDAERHLFAQGLIRPKTLVGMSDHEVTESLIANAIMTIRQCDLILATNSQARVCIIGSESGFAWSYDGAYAASKAALHRYVETKRLPCPVTQQLVCIAPGIIGDARMTLKRTDVDNLNAREAAHPKKRFLTMSEVCRWIEFVLYIDNGYFSNQVIRLNGGEHLK